MDESRELSVWAKKLSSSAIPVLRRTERDLALLRTDDSKLTAHSVANVIKRDPGMAVKLLRYLQSHKHRSQTSDVVEVEQALLMIGMEPFFRNVVAEPLIEALLKLHPLALPPVLRVIHRSHRAAEYAYDWAVQLHDLHFEEVCIAALLHDLAEILMWCFAPDAMLKIHDLQRNDSELRSHDVQNQVLGFTLSQLQQLLAEQWALPSLCYPISDDAIHKSVHTRIVTLAINLARHSANGWDDAALPDDYRAIAELLNIDARQARAMIIPR